MQKMRSTAAVSTTRNRIEWMRYMMERKNENTLKVFLCLGLPYFGHSRWTLTTALWDSLLFLKTLIEKFPILLLLHDFITSLNARFRKKYCQWIIIVYTTRCVYYSEPGTHLTGRTFIFSITFLLIFGRLLVKCVLSLSVDMLFFCPDH